MDNPDDITAIPQKLSLEEIDVLPAFDSSLFLKPKEEIQFIHFFADKDYSLLDVEDQPYFIQAYRNSSCD